MCLRTPFNISFVKYSFVSGKETNCLLKVKSICNVRNCGKDKTISFDRYGLPVEKQKISQAIFPSQVTVKGVLSSSKVSSKSTKIFWIKK